MGDRSRSGSGPDSRDIRALVDDIFDFTATALHIPKGLAKGDTVSTGEQVEAFILFAVRPLAEILETELNAKLYSKADYLNRNFVRLDTSKIQLTDIHKLALAADKLFAGGVNTINDNLELLGREPIRENWADTRFVTKNYQKVNELKKGGKTENGSKEETESAGTA